MAHACSECGGECYCQGDIDDVVTALTPDHCETCGCDEVAWASFDPEDEDEAWMCTCGNYEESGLHCSVCGAEPPWGCPCSGCSEPDYTEDDYYDGLNEFQ